MTTTRTVADFSRLLVLVPVTVCATISYVSNGDVPRCNNDRRLPPHTLAKCRYDSDCMDNAYCWNQEACFCKDDYIVYRNRTHVECLKIATSMGDPCKADVQCHVTFAPFSECRENVCQCSVGSRFEEGRCYESVGLGQACQTHHNCYIPDSFCVSGFCACTLQHHPSSDNTRCLQSRFLGDVCSTDDECISENTRCIDVCVCRVDHVLSADGKKCLKTANSLGESCEENSQCCEFLENSECGPNGTCICMDDYHQRGSLCIKNAKLGHRCVDHRQCITRTYKHSNSTEVMNVDCTDGFCSCAPDYTLTENLDDCIRYSESGTTTYQTCSILLLVLLLGLSRMYGIV